MKSFLFLFFISLSAFSNVHPETNLELELKFLENIHKDYCKKRNKNECKAKAQAGLDIAMDINLTEEIRSSAYYLAAVYQGLITKAEFSVFKIKKNVRSTEVALGNLEKAIELNPQNTDAVINYAKLIREAKKGGRIVARHLRFNLGDKIKYAIDCLDKLENKTHPKFEKYRSFLLENK